MLTTYRTTRYILIVVMTMYAASILFMGHVVYPHNNGQEFGLDVQDPHLTNRKFSDLSRFFITIVHEALADENHAWLATWTSNVQLGHPTSQMWLSKSNIVTHALSFLTQDPLRLITYQSLGLTFLAAAFVFGFTERLRLHPVACLITALGVATGGYYAYWLTFSPFLATYTWAWGILWLIVVFIDEPSWATGIGLSFLIYCLLLMGYPQNIIGVAYPVIAFTLVRLWRSSSTRTQKLRVLLGLAGTAIFGILAALPVYIDVYNQALNSGRVDPDPSFFTQILPQFQSITELAVFLQLIVDPFWFGNPIQPNFIARFDGIAFTPLYAFIFFLSWFVRDRRELWVWHIFFALMLLANLVPEVYLVMVRYLGFNYSRYFPLYAGVMLAFVPIAITLDRILRKQYTPSHIVIVGFVGVMSLSAIAAGFAHQLHLGYVALTFFLVALFVGYLKTERVGLLLVAALLSSLLYGQRMLLTRPMESIYSTAPLVERLRDNLGENERYAWVGEDRAVLLPNMPISLDLNTIHSYDSLASSEFQALMTTLGGEPGTAFGRVYNYLESADVIADPAFSYTGISTILSHRWLESPQLNLVGASGDVFIYRLNTPAIRVTQLTAFTRTAEQVMLRDPLPNYPQLPVQQVINFDDYDVYDLTPSAVSTLLFISEQYNPFWRATSGGVTLETIRVNNFYLGVIVPPETERVTLRFQPYAYWSWVPQVVFVVLGVGLGVGALYRRLVI